MGRDLRWYTEMRFEVHRMFEGLPPWSDTDPSRDADNFADMLIAVRLVKHLPTVDDLSDPGACERWFVEHRRLAKAPLTPDECGAFSAGFAAAFPLEPGLATRRATARALQALGIAS